MVCTNNQYQATGPFNQTLFLGCSVTSIDMNIGWGKETSTCKVSLVKDLYKHHFHPEVAAYKNTIATRSNDSFLNNENANVNESLHRPFHQTILLKEQEKWNQIQQENSRLPPGLRDIAKHCWKTYRSNTRHSFDDPQFPALVYWVDKDPGFIGDRNSYEAAANLDIIGCPVFFRFMDIWFGGMLKKWTFTNNKYDVEINSYASLLEGCKLILGKYYGTISTVMDDTAGALLTGQSLAVPYGDTSYGRNRYNSSVYQGNVPNLFNVFGYLEDRQTGSSGFVEGRGVSAGRIYDGLLDMLEPKINISSAQNMFNPYGAIVARTPFDRTNRTLFDPHQTFFSFGNGPSLLLTEMGLIRAPLAIDGLPRSLFALDITEVPRPPNGVYISEDSMSILAFIEYCCTNANVDYIVDFLPMDMQVNPYYSGVIKIRTITRSVQPQPNIIKDFILTSTFLPNVVSYDFGEEYQDTNTRSVLIGGPQDRLHQFNTYSGGPMGWYRIYEPSIDSFVPIETFANNTTQSNSFANTYRMPDHANQRPIAEGDPPFRVVAGAATAQRATASFNTPETTNYGTNFARGSYMPLQKPSLNPGIIGPNSSYPIYLDIISPYFGLSNNKEYRRVYLNRKTGNLQIVFDFRDIQGFFPTQYDINDGNWGAAAQVARALFNGIALGGSVDTSGGAISSGKFVVDEDELRSALNGLESWGLYSQTSISMGQPTAIVKILYDYIRRTTTPLLANTLFGANLIAVDKIDYLVYFNTVVNWYSARLVRFQNGNMIQNLFPSAFAINNATRYRELNKVEFERVTSSLKALLDNIGMFLQSVAQAHYGKTFAVRLPELRQYTYDNSGNTLYNYSIVQDAWEEEGNMIDDTMETGSLAASSLKSENGKIPALLGFDNSAEYDVPDTRSTLSNYRKTASLTDVHSSLLTPWGLRDRSFLSMSLKNPLQIAGLSPQLANRYYHPLIHNLPADQYVMLPYMALITDTGPPGGRIAYSPVQPSTTAHGLPRDPSHLYKIYAQAGVLDIQQPNGVSKIIFVGNAARTVLSLSSPVFVHSSADDNGASAFITSIILGDQEPDEANVITFPIQPNVTRPNLNQWFAAWPPGARIGFTGVTDTKKDTQISPRAAKPVFAAIPMRYNLMTYGPWVSHPGLIAGTIFPNQANTPNELAALVNNLVGGVEVKVDPTLVPWEYGGMLPLDAAALALVSQNNGFQQVLETGTITLAGIMLENWILGGYILGDLGPIVNSIKIAIGDSGITTQYSLRTFSRKIGFFNKEQADNIKNINKAILLQNRRMAESIKDLQRRLIDLASKMNKRLV